LGAKVEFENERVRVLRVQHAGRERHLEESRLDRVVIYMNDGRVSRTEGGKKEQIRRKAGEVVWKTRSQHYIENLKDTNHEVIIVELKQ
jgi:hypothetical protein